MKQKTVTIVGKILKWELRDAIECPEILSIMLIRNDLFKRNVSFSTGCTFSFKICLLA